MSFWSSLVVSQSMASESGDRATLLADPELQAALRRFVRGVYRLPKSTTWSRQRSPTRWRRRAPPTKKTSSSAGSTALPGTGEADHSDAIAVKRRGTRRRGRRPSRKARRTAPASCSGGRSGSCPKATAPRTRLNEEILREGAGEKLELIAAEHDLPAPHVKQRVSRLRKHFRERWAAAVAAVAVVGLILLGILAVIVRLREPAPEARVPTPEPVPVNQAYEIRREALGACEKSEWPRCIEGLDRARSLWNPLGDQAEPVQRAREAAARGLGLAPVPSSSDSSEAPPTFNEPDSKWMEREKKPNETAKKGKAVKAIPKPELEAPSRSSRSPRSPSAVRTRRSSTIWSSIRKNEP